MRIDCPLVVADKNKKNITAYIVSEEDIDYLISVAASHSLYSIAEQLRKGYIAYNGIRIGVSGEGVYDGGQFATLKNINSVNIRIPHQIPNAAKPLERYIKERLYNILIVSPPGLGKTTLLREICRLYSDSGYNILLIDERYEIAGVYKRRAALNVGRCTDTVSNLDKRIVYENVIRAFRPDMIITDEIFTAQEVELIRDIRRSGVSVCASVHADGLEAVGNSSLKNVLQCFDIAAVLKEPLGSMEIIELQ